MIRKIRSKLSNIPSKHPSVVFKNENVLLSQKQPKNLLRLLTRTRFNTEINAFQQQNTLFKCIEERCKIYSLYIVEGHSFYLSIYLSIYLSNLKAKTTKMLKCIKTLLIVKT